MALEIKSYGYKMTTPLSFMGPTTTFLCMEEPLLFILNNKMYYIIQFLMEKIQKTNSSKRLENLGFVLIENLGVTIMKKQDKFSLEKAQE